MTNLEYLAWFLEDTYGAICFHNEVEDGYVEFPSEENKEMETLAVYFPNEIDLMDQEVAERLTKKAGKEFYKRYKGALGMRVCPIMSNYLFVRYSKDGVVLRLCQEQYGVTHMTYYEPLSVLAEYFLGVDISHVNAKAITYLSMPTNNGLDLGINSDMEIAYEEFKAIAQNYRANPHGNMKEILEDFLMKHNKPLVTKENGFHIAPDSNLTYSGRRAIVYDGRNRRMVKQVFGDSIRRCQQIAIDRYQAYNELRKYLTVEEWNAWKKACGFEFVDRECKKNAKIYADYYTNDDEDDES